MLAPSRLLMRSCWSIEPLISARHSSSRALSTFSPLHSGHSRWSTIKHDKAKNDSVKNKQRSIFARDILEAAKSGGPDPDANPRLALAITKAKKSGFPKSSIEATIARAQGISPTGAKLETVTVEAMLPPSVAVIIECQTDNRNRTLSDIRLAVKNHEGTVTPTAYMFEKKGRIVFPNELEVSSDDVMEHSLDAGALDVWENNDDNTIAVIVEPKATKEVAEKLAEAFGEEPLSTDIIWEPDDSAILDINKNDDVIRLGLFFEDLREVSGIQGVWMNADRGMVERTLWEDLKSKLVY